VTVAEVVERELMTASLCLPAEPREAYDISRCELLGWTGEELSDDDSEGDVPLGVVAAVRCAHCHHAQPVPTRKNPACERCGTWLLANVRL
jgi:hypothetical protein